MSAAGEGRWDTELVPIRGQITMILRPHFPPDLLYICWQVPIHTHACELWSTVCVIRIKKYKGTEPYLWLAIHVLFLASDTVVFVTSDEGEKK